MNLQEFVRLPHGFSWGGSGRYDASGKMRNDCHLICASWATQLIGFDPASGLRGTYSDEAGARAILDRSGGSVRLFASIIEPHGFKRVQDPEPGDIGVVIAPVGMIEFCQIGGIRFGPMWACLGPTGMIARRLETVACWRFAG